jgi:tRNA G46 methylase TrmB
MESVFCPSHGWLGRSDWESDASSMWVYRIFKLVSNLQLFFLAYAWDKVPADSVICDIGGGNGHATLGLVKKFPHLKIVVQDLAVVVHQGREVSSSFVLLF